MIFQLPQFTNCCKNFLVSWSPNFVSIIWRQTPIRRVDSVSPSIKDGTGTSVDEIPIGNIEGKQKFAIGPFSMVAIAFNTCNSWAGVSGSIQTAMLQGGPMALLYGMMISTSAYLSIALVLLLNV